MIFILVVYVILYAFFLHLYAFFTTTCNIA